MKKNSRSPGLARFFLEASPKLRICSRKVNLIQKRPLVKPRTARDHRDASARVNTGHVGARMLLIGGHRGLVANLQDIYLMMRNSATLFKRSFRRTDIHSTVKLKRICRNQLPSVRPHIRGQALCEI